MPGKMIWDRARDEHNDFDRNIGRDWRAPSLPGLDFIGDGLSLEARRPEYGLAPNVAWSREMALRYPEPGGRAALDIRRIAEQAAHDTFNIDGPTILIQRVSQFHARVGSFPSAWFAVSFDYAARMWALSHPDRSETTRQRRARMFRYAAMSSRNHGIRHTAKAASNTMFERMINSTYKDNDDRRLTAFIAALAWNR